MALIDQRPFRTAFVLGPFLMFSIVPAIVPALVFGSKTTEIGTNLIWGFVFGIGWLLCIVAYKWHVLSLYWCDAGGLLWALFVPVLLFYVSGWLWRSLTDRGRKIALTLLALSFLCDLPAKDLPVKTVWELDQRPIPFPDFNLIVSGAE